MRCRAAAAGQNDGPAPVGSPPTLEFRFRSAEALPFEINRLERMHPMAMSAVPHRHRFHMVLWVTRGTGTHLVDFEEIPVRADAVLALAPGQVHSWSSAVEVAGFAVLFLEDFLALDPAGPPLLDRFPFPRLGEGQPVLAPIDDDRAFLAETMACLEREYRASRRGRPEMLRAYLRVLLIGIDRMAREGAPPTPTAAPELARRFAGLVEARFREQKRVHAYAARLAVTPGHLNEAVRLATGRTAGTILRDRIVLEAKRLLFASDRSVAEIAAELGFDDPSYFGRFFRREVGRSPVGFRKTFREKYRNGP